MGKEKWHEGLAQWRRIAKERERDTGKTHEKKEAGGGVGRTVKENSDYQDQRLVAHPMFL